MGSSTRVVKQTTCLSDPGDLVVVVLIMRTLTFGDRTISYDAGLDTMDHVISGNTSQDAVKTSSDLQYEMSERKVSVAKSESADSGVGADNIENQDDHEECNEIEQRRVIKPDDVAVRELLNFDEEEEDEYFEEESDIDEDDAQNRMGEARNQSVFNKKWRQAIVKDLTRSNSVGRSGQQQSPSSSLSRSDSLDQVLTSAVEQGNVKLSLKEVGHIRRVLARAELETSQLSVDLKTDLESGRVCGVCRRTRFGRITRGVTCNRCVVTDSRVASDTMYDITDIPKHLLAPDTDPADLGGHRGRHNCAGSAPNSPQTSRRSEAGGPSDNLSLPLQPPLVTSRSTIPRRWSMVMWPRLDLQPREASITVCLLCKNMIKQILRTKGYNKRM